MKPIVYYIGKATIVDRGEYCVAHLVSVVNHPELGRDIGVRTSKIVSQPDKYGCFETLNTKYMPVEFSLYAPEFVTSIGVTSGN